MIDTVIRLTLLVFIAMGLLACSQEGEVPDPKTLPYRFEMVHVYGRQ